MHIICLIPAIVYYIRIIFVPVFLMHKDTSFYAKVNQHKRICLSEKDYQNLCNKLPTETTDYQMEIYFIILLIYYINKLLVLNFLINLIG